MGFGGIGIWQLLIILVIVVLLFGTKKVRNIGSDLGGAIRNFRSSMKDGGKEEQTTEPGKIEENAGTVIDGEVDAGVEEKKRESA